MNEELQQRADEAIAAYRDEIDEGWSAVPIWVVRSRERLSSFIALRAPEWVIKSEIAMLTKRIKAMEKARLKR
jgi:hypothetical protein